MSRKPIDYVGVSGAFRFKDNGDPSSSLYDVFQYQGGKQVKIPRSAVALTRISTNMTVRNNWMLKRLFDIAARGVPLAPPGTVRRPSRPALHAAAPAPEYSHAVRAVPLERGARRSEGRSAL